MLLRLSLVSILAFGACTRTHDDDAKGSERDVAEQPPRPSLPAADARFACSRHGDCVASCRHGAVARAWYEAAYPGGEACEDGCTSKGTEPPTCMNGGCVARRAGKDDPICTRLDHPPLAGPGPAHACQRDADCTNDCALGAVNAAWLTTQADRPACKDGCTSKGTEAARCEDGTCVAYRLGARDPSCTRQPVW
jgi:hypothetical protein